MPCASMDPGTDFPYTQGWVTRLCSTLTEAGGVKTKKNVTTERKGASTRGQTTPRITLKFLSSKQIKSKLTNCMTLNLNLTLLCHWDSAMEPLSAAKSTNPSRSMVNKCTSEEDTSWKQSWTSWLKTINCWVQRKCGCLDSAQEDLRLLLTYNTSNRKSVQKQNCMDTTGADNFWNKTMKG